ncbi:hypothetical protein HOLleu_30533 [Holothuria leucospilota]|uniref:CIDE-N domain-containing protein n=1 Tax=Holothuria leucospilota TaxID=206669 RepID=A0A9Q1BKI3_HOLLE|nr:hypothetical protein HOLleu_30533 [Holothuria leucospilota]
MDSNRCFDSVLPRNEPLRARVARLKQRHEFITVVSFHHTGCFNILSTACLSNGSYQENIHIWTWDRKSRKAVSSAGFEELKQKGIVPKHSVNLAWKLVITLEDGTEIDDDNLGLVSEEPLIFGQPESFQLYTDDNGKFQGCYKTVNSAMTREPCRLLANINPQSGSKAKKGVKLEELKNRWKRSRILSGTFKLSSFGSLSFTFYQ